MNTVLLDTNIISFIMKGDTRILAYKPYLDGKILGISFMTVAELFQWAEIKNWGENRKNQLQQTLRNYLVLSYDIQTCQLWGTIRAERKKMGLPISSQDAWIAATAVQYSIPLATHNPSDFQKIDGLTIITTLP